MKRGRDGEGEGWRRGGVEKGRGGERKGWRGGGTERGRDREGEGWRGGGEGSKPSVQLLGRLRTWVVNHLSNLHSSL